MTCLDPEMDCTVRACRNEHSSGQTRQGSLTRLMLQENTVNNPLGDGGGALKVRATGLAQVDGFILMEGQNGEGKANENAFQRIKWPQASTL